MSIGITGIAYHGVGLVEKAASQGVGAETQPRPLDAGSLENTAVSLEKIAADKVTISLEAYEKQSQAKTEDEEVSLWESKYNLKNGSTILKNGHRQEVVIEGSKMQILEYNGDKLVRKETGVIDGDTLTRDVELYDKRGRVSQTAHSVLTGIGDDNDLDSVAVLTRDMQWFENGELVLELHDNAKVNASYRPADGIEPVNLDDLTGRLTRDMINVDYFADIKEYANGKLSRSATIESNVDAQNKTNRMDKDLGDFVSHRTREISNASALDVTMISYDADGNLLRTDTFQDEVIQGGEQKQTLSTSWYNRGELVKKSRGTFSAEAGEGHNLQRRAQIFEVLGLDEEEYSASKPLSASNLLNESSKEHSVEGDFFVKASNQKMGMDGYDPGQYFEENADSDYAHQLTWTEEMYKEGELAARSVDESSSRENAGAGELQFRSGVGLTERESPALLSRSKHTRESYENGRVVREGSTEFREFLEEDERGVDRLKTAVSGTLDGTDENSDITKVVMGSVINADNLAGTANEGMSAASDVFTRDFVGMMRDAQSNMQD